MPIKFAVKIVQLKIYIIFSQSDDFAFHSKSQLHFKVDNFLTYKYYNTINSISNILGHISAMAFKLDMAVDLCMDTCSCLFWWPWPWCKVSHSGLAEETNRPRKSWIFSTTKQVTLTIIKLATAVGHFSRDLDFENIYIYIYGLTILSVTERSERNINDESSCFLWLTFCKMKWLRKCDSKEGLHSWEFKIKITLTWAEFLCLTPAEG